MIRFYVTEQLSENISETPEGYLLCQNVPITRTGEFLYKGDELLGEDSKPLVEPTSDGIVRIQRLEENVFDENTVRSFEGKPLTIDHPNGFVAPENWQELSHGIIQNVRRGNNGNSDLLLADILVTTEDAIKLIKAGQRELSCGYDAEYSQIDIGIGKQTNIIGNHVALVSKGRAGGRCAIQDKACNNCGSCNCKNNDKEQEEETVTLKQKIKKWFDSCPIKIKDEDEDLEKKKEEEEKETKDDDLSLEDLNVSGGKKGPVEAEDSDEDDEEKKTKDEGDYESRLSRIEKLLEELLAIEEDEGETSDKKTKDEDSDEDEDDEKKKKESETEDDDEEEEMKEKEEKEKKEVTDAWPEFLANAEILSPGVKLRKPIREHRKTFDNMMVNILEGAIESNEFGEEIEKLAGRKGFHKMTGDALEVAFAAASTIAARKRNSKVQDSSVRKPSFEDAKSVRSINEANKSFYKR